MMLQRNVLTIFKSRRRGREREKKLDMCVCRVFNSKVHLVCRNIISPDNSTANFFSLLLNAPLKINFARAAFRIFCCCCGSLYEYGKRHTKYACVRSRNTRKIRKHRTPSEYVKYLNFWNYLI